MSKNKMFNEGSEMPVRRICVDIETGKGYDYTSSLFVAVVSDRSVEGAPSWIRRAVNPICNSNGRVTKLTVH